MINDPAALTVSQAQESPPNQKKSDIQNKLVTEYLACKRSSFYFIYNYVKILDATRNQWIPFELWPEQAEVLDKVESNRKIIALKARQLGLSWLILAHILWKMLFIENYTAGVFSKTETDSVYLIGPERLRGMYDRLPGFLKFAPDISFPSDAAKTWIMPNGSSCRAFPVKGGAGDGYTFSEVLVDEAALCPDLALLLRSVEPTISGGGKMILISRANKDAPVSAFNNIFEASRKGQNDYTHVFLPWHIRPERDSAWYEAQKADSLSIDGSLDTLFEQYPESIEQALAPKALGKRFPFERIKAVYEPQDPIIIIGRYGDKVEGLPEVPGLRIYELPEEGESYVIGSDTAEGNPNSDFSTLVISRESNGDEIATFQGRVEPSILGDYIIKAGEFYNEAPALIERNNHGHATIQWVTDKSETIKVLYSPIDNKPGWLSNRNGKIVLYDGLSDKLREGDCTIRDMDIFNEVAALEGATLRAPDGLFDDLADAYALSQAARGLSATKWRSIKFIKFKQD